jgi:predicted nucleotidyltransferase component of viral defense system
MISGKIETAVKNVLFRIISAAILPADCYLAGGTALYFHFHHRLSVDLDFFSPRVFNPELLLFKFREVFEKVNLGIMESETLVLFLSPDKIKVSLFYFPYKLLAPKVNYEIERGLFAPLASLEDIEAMKAVALVQRGSAKDFIDLFYLLRRSRHSLNDLFNLVKGKYDVEENYIYQLKTSLVYFDEAEKELDGIMLIEATGVTRQILEKEWQEIKNFFLRFCL